MGVGPVTTRRRPSGCERILQLLADGRWHSTYELQVGLGVMAHSRVSDLRKRGYLIETRRTSGEGLHANEYRLVAAPDETTAPPIPPSPRDPVAVVSSGADRAATPSGDSAPTAPGPPIQLVLV
jgi:hypothetical protein